MYASNVSYGACLLSYARGLGLTPVGLEIELLRSASWALHIHAVSHPNINPGHQGPSELPWLATLCMCGHTLSLGELRAFPCNSTGKEYVNVCGWFLLGLTLGIFPFAHCWLYPHHDREESSFLKILWICLGHLKPKGDLGDPQGKVLTTAPGI